MAICEKCKSNNVIESENGNYCCNCGWDSTKKKYVKKHTNADRIRSMNDEELAELFSKIDKGWDVICGSYISIKPGVLICGRDDFAKQILNWLQSEAE